MGGVSLRTKLCVCFLSDLLLNSRARHHNSTSSPFSIVSLVFIGLDKLLVIFGFIGGGICDRCGKVGCNMMIFSTVCAWLHGHGVNIGCSKLTSVFWGDCWNIFGSLDSCWLFMQIFNMLLSE